MSNTDLRVRHLERKLAMARAAGDTLYAEGYALGRRHSRLEVPETLITALRHGSAHEHVHIPLGDEELLTIVLASTGNGKCCDQREARAWEALERVRTIVKTQARPGVDYVHRQELPPGIAAAIWRWPEHTAIITSTTTARPRLRAALHTQRSGWVLIPIVGWTLARRLARGLTHTLAPSATVAAMSAAAVTAIAAAPANDPPVERVRGHAVHGEAPQSPLAYVPGDRPRVRRRVTPTPVPETGQTQASEAPTQPPVAAVPAPSPEVPDPAPPATLPAPVGSQPPASAPPTSPPGADSGDDGSEHEPTPTGGPDASDTVGCLLSDLAGVHCASAR